MTTATLTQLNALTGGLFLLCTFGIVAMRQVLGILKMFILQSIFLSISAFLLGYIHMSIHLFAVAALTLMVKPLLIPYLLKRMVGNEVTARREISQLVDIPSSLLIAVLLTILSYFIANHLLSNTTPIISKVNLPIGLACLLLGAYTIIVRQEAVAQTIGILTMENGAFFAGVSIAPDLPLIAEVAAAFDVLIIAIVMGLLARKIYEKVGITTVGEMNHLREVEKL
ncbi:MAG: hypothetical protein GXO97_04285 [Nitrospirae bacterium]|nr:hypothetical protein [Nitrospirota bacterium]